VERLSRTIEGAGHGVGPGGFQSEPVPDEQNFAATPFVQRWFSERTNAHKWTDDAYSKTAPRVADNTNDVSHRLFLDLVAWKLAFTAVKAGQTNFGPAIHIGQT